MGTVRADIIELQAPLETLLGRATLEDLVLEMEGLYRRALAGGLAHTAWLPTVVAAEDEPVYGLCLNNPSHATGAGEWEALRDVTSRLAEYEPVDTRFEYGLRTDIYGQPYAVRATLRLRIEHWRVLAVRIWESLRTTLCSAAHATGRQPAGLLAGRAWPSAGANVLSDFAEAQSEGDLLRFTKAVTKGPDPLHLRVSLCCHVLSLRRIRLGNPGVYADVEALLGRLESEIYGDYNLDGQAAYRALRSVGWDSELEIMEM